MMSMFNTTRSIFFVDIRWREVGECCVAVASAGASSTRRASSWQPIRVPSIRRLMFHVKRRVPKYRSKQLYSKVMSLPPASLK